MNQLRPVVKARPLGASHPITCDVEALSWVPPGSPPPYAAPHPPQHPVTWEEERNWEIEGRLGTPITWDTEALEPEAIGR